DVCSSDLFHDEFDFHAQLAVAGPSAGGGATAGNDTLSVAAGTQAVDGLGGIDTAVFAGARAAYSVSQSSANAWTVSGPDGVTTVTNVERLSFADAKVALDIGGDAGMAYRLYKAAFDRVPDIGGLGFQMKALDDGWSLSAVAANFIASPEFQSKYGNVDDTQFISLLYQNVLDRAPDDAGLQFHLGELASGQTRADI